MAAVQQVSDDTIEPGNKAPRDGRTMGAGDPLLDASTLTEAEKKKRMLDALAALPWDDPAFRPERSRDTGRRSD